MTVRDLVALGFLAVVPACNGEDPPGGKGGGSDDTPTDPGSEPGVEGDGDGDGFGINVDCDDDDAAVYPGAPDRCGDDRVTDCDRESDDGLVTVVGGATFDDLQAALDAAPEGSELLVCPGTWLGAFHGAVAVDLASYGGDEVTTIDGVSAGAALSLPGGSAITGFTVTGGSQNGLGGGIIQSSPGTFSVVDCVVTGNTAASGAGIALADHSTVTIRGTTVSANTARRGVGGGLSIPTGTAVDLTGSAIEGNTAKGGGGIYVDGGSVTGGLVSDNRSETVYVTGYRSQGGGGIALVGSVTLSGVEITGNTSEWGGGVAVATGATAALEGVDIHDNSAPNGGAGGGLFVDGAATMSGSTSVTGNEATYGGGAYMGLNSNLSGGRFADNVVDPAYGEGGGIFLLYATVDGVDVEGNDAFQGGGVYLYGQSSVSNSAISGNTADIGGGVGTTECYDYETFCADRPMALDTVEITDNTARVGGGLDVLTPVLTLTDVSVLRNTATEQGGGAAIGAGVSAAMSSVASDWGAGADDNVPSDVFAGSEVSGYPADATFDCTETGCTPDP